MMIMIIICSHLVSSLDKVVAALVVAELKGDVGTSQTSHDAVRFYVKSFSKFISQCKACKN